MTCLPCPAQAYMIYGPVRECPKFVTSHVFLANPVSFYVCQKRLTQPVLQDSWLVPSRPLCLFHSSPKPSTDTFVTNVNLRSPDITFSTSGKANTFGPADCSHKDCTNATFSKSRYELHTLLKCRKYRVFLCRRVK